MRQRHGQVEAVGAVAPRITPRDQIVPPLRPPSSDIFTVRITGSRGRGWYVEVTHDGLENSEWCFTFAGAKWWAKRCVIDWRRRDRNRAAATEYRL